MKKDQIIYTCERIPNTETEMSVIKGSHAECSNSLTDRHCCSRDMPAWGTM